MRFARFHGIFRRVGCLAILICTVGLAGCGIPARYRTPARLDSGFTIILPGIEGASFLNSNVAKGLIDGGVPSSVEVYDWTASPLLFPINLRDYWRNRHEARIVARKIVEYQARYPGRPVHLIGHSGGGGIAIMALEELPPRQQITSAILLAPAVAPDYDLRRALLRTRCGIWNYYSPYDVGFLRAGTMLLGTIEGRHTSAAGAVGFTTPWGLDDEDKKLYSDRLHQQRYSRKMAEDGHTGGHMGWASRGFVSHWLAPIIQSQIEAEARVASDAHPKPGSLSTH